MIRKANPALLFCLSLFLIQALFLVELPAQECRKQLKVAQVESRNKRYQQASELYHASWPCIEANNKILFEAGLCHYTANQIERAIRCFEQIAHANPEYNNELKWQLARCYHQNKNFRKALVYYKQYLKKISQDEPRAAFIRNELIRCSYGLKYQRRESAALVESFGPDINSSADEFAACPGFQSSNKIYFSSDRRENNVFTEQDRRKQSEDDKDLFYSVQNGGKWLAPKRFTSEINSSLNEQVLDFANEGRVLLFQRSSGKTPAKIFADTLLEDQPRLHYQSFTSPVIPEIGDHALSLFQDTVLIFSSKRLGGYGAYDLYFSIFRNGKWSEPINLGPGVNSNFNEDYPFLAKDGRTLYFSSDRLNSMGGFDIYVSRFQVEAAKWTEPYNLGLPVNSPADDTDFKLTNDGYSGVLTSDRKYDNFGKRDIYLVYFKEELYEQSEDAGGSPLSLLLDYPSQASKSEVQERTTAAENQVSNSRSFTVEPVFYNEDENMQAASNQKVLDQIAKLLLSNSSLKLEIAGYSFEESKPTVNLYYSIKKAERIRDYLIERNVDGMRMHCVGLGSAFPLAKTQINGLKPAQSDHYNKRVEFKFNLDQLPGLRIQYSGVAIPDFLISVPVENFYTKTQSLYYSIFLGEFPGLLPKNMEPGGQELLWGEREIQTGPYSYYYGLYSNFKAAQTALNALQYGYPGPISLRAGINGSWLQREQFIDHVLDQPDLLLFMNYLNEKH